MIDSEQTKSAPTVQHDSLHWVVAALIVAVAGAAGSLWLSIGMGLKACPLCLYQRTFILAILGVLVVGLVIEVRHAGLLNALALPAAVGGLGVAVFHEFLELTGKLEFPAGILDWGTAPQQSLTIFVVLSSVLVVPLIRNGRLAVTATGVVLGLLFALSTIKSAPPMPTPPERPYDKPLEVCRPPFHSANGEVDTP